MYKIEDPDIAIFHCHCCKVEAQNPLPQGEETLSDDVEVEFRKRYHVVYFFGMSMLPGFFFKSSDTDYWCPHVSLQEIRISLLLSQSNILMTLSDVMEYGIPVQCLTPCSTGTWHTRVICCNEVNFCRPASSYYHLQSWASHSHFASLLLSLTSQKTKTRYFLILLPTLQRLYIF